MVKLLLGLLLIYLIFKVVSMNKKEEERLKAVDHDVDVYMGVVKDDTLYLVTKVIDGDTLVLNNKITVRLANVDAYEASSPIHPDIMKFMNTHVYNKYVHAYLGATDKYGRVIGKIILPNGQNLAEELVLRGFALVYEKYIDKSSDEYVALKRAEDQARIYKIGGYGMLLLEPWLDRKNK